MEDELKLSELQKEPFNQAPDKGEPIERVKNNLYSGIKVSLRTMDLIILSIAVLLIITIFIGVFTARF